MDERGPEAELDRVSEAGAPGASAVPAATPGSTARRVGLFALAFGSGFAVLAIEIAGARMIAPVFGLSAIPWTAVIGVILAALAVGSHLGGRLADQGRVPLPAILLAAGATGALPVIGAGVPWIARDFLGFIPGAVMSALVLFAPSVLCLGAVVPFLVQADTESLGTVGRRAGDMSAAATAGSIAGSFTTGFILLPLMPLPVLMAATAGVLFLMAAFAGRLLGGRVPDGTLVVAAVCVGGLSLSVFAPVRGLLHAEQTLYSSVLVTEREWRDGRRVRELWQNGGSSSAEYVDDGSPAHDYATVSLELLRPGLSSAASALVLGGAALTLPVALVRQHPGLAVDVVEIDASVTELARAYFAVGGLPDDAVRVIHDDARVFLRGSPDRYDLVYMDVFDHLLTVPWTMVTREAFQAMAEHLTPGGVFAANVLSPLDGVGADFLHRLQATLEEVFDEVRIHRVDPDADLRTTQNLIVTAGSSASLLPDGGARVVDVPAEGRPFSDAWAPVEYLQARVFVQGLGWN